MILLGSLWEVVSGARLKVAAVSQVKAGTSPGSGPPLAVMKSVWPGASRSEGGSRDTRAHSASPVGVGFPAQCHPAFVTPTPASDFTNDPSSLTDAVPLATNQLK